MASDVYVLKIKIMLKDTEGSIKKCHFFRLDDIVLMMIIEPVSGDL